MAQWLGLSDVVLAGRGDPGFGSALAAELRRA